MKNVGFTLLMVPSRSLRSRGFGMSAMGLPVTKDRACTPTFAYTWNIGSGSIRTLSPLLITELVQAAI